MANPFVLSSSDGFSGSLPYNRFRGLVLSGTIQIDNLNSGITGPIAPIGGIAVLQSTASIASQTITTTAQFASAAFIYIPQGTVTVTSSTNAGVAAAPPYNGMGAALYWNASAKKLSVYSTVSGDWFTSAAFTSSA